MTGRSWALLLLGAVSACSVLNREGPDVSCSDLDNGGKNACQDGIIATCVNGTVKYEVCDSKDACGESWQVAYHYQCDQSGSGGSGGTSGIGGTSGSGGTGAVSGNGGTGAVGGTGGSAGCDPSGPCVIATTSGGNIEAYVVDDTNAYFATKDSLFSVPKAGGFPKSLASGPNAESFGEIAVDDTHVYLLRDDYSSTSNLVRVTKSGGAFEVVVPAEYHFAIDAERIYWAGPNSTHKSLFARAKAGGPSSTIIDNFNLPGSRVVVYGGFLYWLGVTGLQRVAASATGAVATAVPLVGSVQQDLAVDADGVYFTTGTSIGHVPLSGGPASEIVASIASPFHITTRGSDVYWEGTYTGLWKAAKAGGATNQLYESGVVLGRIVGDDTHVYWAQGGSLYRVPR